MERVDLLLVQLHAAELLLNDLEAQGDEKFDELREAMREATVCAYRFKIGRTAMAASGG